MNKSEYETSFTLEETYWWYIGQRYLLESLLKKHYHDQPNLNLIDIGCGTGINLQLLQKFGTAKGIDISEQAKAFCKQRGLDIELSDILNMPFSNHSFDVVTSLGVFYHRNIPDDTLGMNEIYRILKPGGRLFFFDSAMPCLFGKHDIAFHGIRRYSKTELRKKLENSGFEIEKLTYVNSFMFPLVYLKRKLEKLSPAPPKSEVKELSPSSNQILKALYLFELKGASYFNYPFGINILAIARVSR